MNYILNVHIFVWIHVPTCLSLATTAVLRMSISHFGYKRREGTQWPLKPTHLWVWPTFYPESLLNLHLASNPSNHQPDRSTFSCSAMVTTPPTSPIGSVELLPHRCIHLVWDHSVWHEWDEGRQGRESEQLPNQETLACADILQPAFLFCSVVHSTGHTPNAGGPAYGECNGMF